MAAGGFHPKRVLPVVLDIGTSNQKLLEDPRYLGRKAPRLEGDEYYEFIGNYHLIKTCHTHIQTSSWPQSSSAGPGL